MRLLLLATKDTIAYRDGFVATGAELLESVATTADVTVEDLLTEPGFDTTPGTMAATARRVRKALGEDGFQGVVVTHGTDTLEEAAYLTDLMAGAAAARGSIVYTAAAHPADGPANLAAALAAAADPALRGLGAVACVSGDLHAARWVHQATTGTFTSSPHEPLGRGRAPLRPQPAPPGEIETNVALIKAYPGIEANLLTTAVDAGARGIVLEGTGAHNVPVSLLGAITDLVAWDIPVVVCSRARTAGPPQLPDGLAAQVGAILTDLPAGKAFVALMVALGGDPRVYFAALSAP
ncbi:asparaginase domain-containing protein [Dactylosporangium sp. CS-047395]|uniref:asparaginase domain-containing protein n=1 Tax=Dactylosporangium sp. CS-047395 TaxID=3239936 RepID=UPI003D912582